MAKGNQKGSSIFISDELLTRITTAETEFENLKKKADETATAINNAFLKITDKGGGVFNLIDSIKILKTELGNISTGNLGKEFENIAKNAKSASSAISQSVRNINNSASSKSGSSGLDIFGLSKKELTNKNFVSQLSTLKEYKQALIRIQSEINGSQNNATTRNALLANLAQINNEIDRLTGKKSAIRNTINELFTTSTNGNAFQKKLNSLTNGNMSYNATRDVMQRLIALRKNLNTADAEGQQKTIALDNAIRQLNSNLKRQDETMKGVRQRHSELFDISGQLARSFALMFSVSQMKQYLSTLIDVRGEFELQQRSLEAILQNKSEADSIFNQVVSLAVRSPFQIKELIKYTKQLAAYRIENDKLYDTTKRLADVSAGIGIDLSRLILAYGQVKAAAYLRGQEVRQFTEAGINLYGELQSYFQEVKGEAYTTKQIVDMISKKQVTFEDIEQVFKRLTSEGGIFFNMQEIQAETLRGKVSNLKDSFDVLLNSLGTESEGLLKGAVDMLTAMMSHVTAISGAVKTLLGAFVGAGIGQIIMKWGAPIQHFITAIKLAEGGVGKLVAAFKTMSMTMRGLVGGSLFGLVVGGLYTWYSAAEEAKKKHRELIEEINNNKNGLEVRLDTLSENFKASKKIEEQKTYLSKLQKELDQYHISLKVDLERVTSENIKEVFEDAQHRIREVSKYARDLSIDIENKDYKNTSIKEVADDANKSYAEMQSHIVRIKNALAEIYTDERFKYFKGNIKELLNGPKKGADELEHWERAFNKIMTLRQMFSGNSDVLDISKADDYFKSYTESLKSLSTKWDDYLISFARRNGELIQKAKSGNKEIANDAIATIKSSVERVIEEKQLNELAANKVREFTTKWAEGMGIKGLSFKINQDEVARQVSWVEAYLKDFFAKKQFKINLGVDEKDLNSAVTFAEEGLKANQQSTKNVETLKNFLQLIKNGGFKGSIDATGDKRQFFLDAGLVHEVMNPNVASWNNKDLGLAKLDRDSVPTKEVESYIKKQLKLAEKTNEALGGNLKGDKKAARDAAKREQDIWQARIDVMKKMRSQYERLRKYTSKDKAAADVMDMFGPAMNDAKMPQDMMDILKGGANSTNIISALQVMRDKHMPGKSTQKQKENVSSTIAEYTLEDTEKATSEQIERMKKQFEQMFTELDLRDSLRKAGFDDSLIDTMFGDLPKNLDEISGKINAALLGKDGSEFDKLSAEYADKIKNEQTKINRDRKKEEYAAEQELLKQYGEYEERKQEIQRRYQGLNDSALSAAERANLGARMQQELDDLKKELSDKTMNWETVFTHLDDYSLEYLKEIQKILKEQLSSSDIDPQTAVALSDKLNKANSEIVKRRGEWKNIIGLSIPELEKINQLEEEMKLAEENNKRAQNELINALNEELRIREQIAQLMTDNGITTTANEVNISNLDELRDKLKKQGSNQAINSFNDLATKYGKSVQRTNTATTQANNSSTVLTSIKNAYGGSSGASSLAITDAIIHGVNQNLQSLSKLIDDLGLEETKAGRHIKKFAESSNEATAAFDSLKQGDFAGVAQHLNQAFGTLGESLGMLGIKGFGSSDRNLDRDIENLTRSNQELQEAITNLTNEMKDANTEDISGVYDTQKEAIDEIISNTQEMMWRSAHAHSDGTLGIGGKSSSESKVNKTMNAEDWKRVSQAAGVNVKDARDFFNLTSKEMANVQMYATDMYSKIKNAASKGYRDAGEYMDNYIKLYKQLEEIDNARNEKLTSISFDSMTENFKNQLKNMSSSVDDFADDMQETLNEAIINSIIESDYFQTKFKALHKKLADYMQSDNKMEQWERDDWQKDYMEIAEELLTWRREAGSLLSSSSSLSALQQGIQGVTEKTAEALESLLNSIRFFVADQQRDTAAILAFLREHQASLTMSNADSPLLSELRSQTAILRDMRTMWDRVIKPSTGGGFGLKVIGLS